ncbi:MAG: SCO family protein [Gammaproteobacteria bacterium]|jgi:protein SCO1/2|nr:SCO family protein [Gammaproteobacteria bacterium]
MSARPLRRHLISGVGALLLAGAAAGAPAGIAPPPPAEPVFDGDAAYALSQQAVGRLVGDYRFTAADGREVSLADLRGRPLVVSLVYTSCYQICSMTTRSLARTVRAARAVLGDESFAVLTIGFDTPVDTPAAMAAFAVEQGVREADWQFLSGDAATLAALTRDLGFTYQRSPKGFDHLLQTTVLDADGRVYRQVYGEVIDAPWLVEPLKELVLGTRPEDGALARIVSQVRMYCVTYDPATGTYRNDYSLYIGMAIGAAIIVAVAGFLVREVRHARSV